MASAAILREQLRYSDTQFRRAVRMNDFDDMQRYYREIRFAHGRCSFSKHEKPEIAAYERECDTTFRIVENAMRLAELGQGMPQARIRSSSSGWSQFDTVCACALGALLALAFVLTYWQAILALAATVALLCLGFVYKGLERPASLLCQFLGLNALVALGLCVAAHYVDLSALWEQRGAVAVVANMFVLAIIFAIASTASEE